MRENNHRINNIVDLCPEIKRFLGQQTLQSQGAGIQSKIDFQLKKNAFGVANSWGYVLSPRVHLETNPGFTFMETYTNIAVLEKHIMQNYAKLCKLCIIMH